MIQSKKFFESKVDISRKLNDKIEKYLRKSIKKQVNSHRVYSFNFQSFKRVSKTKIQF